MIPISVTFFHGLAICIPFSLFALVTFLLNPRLWLHSLPPDVVLYSKPRTTFEKSIIKFLLMPLYLIILPGMSLVSMLWLMSYSEASISLPGILLHMYGMWGIVHLWDFLVLDCIAVIMLDSRHNSVITTTSGQTWDNISFHLSSLLKAVIFSSIFLIPASIILWLLS